MTDARPTSAPLALRLLPLLAFAGALLLATRHGLRLSFDGYYYVEYAKQFRHELPPAFGSAWPYGWPLAGAAMGLLGLGAYHGLLVLAIAAWGGTLWLAARHWPWTQTGRAAGLLALGLAAVLAAASSLVAGIFSEVPFAFITLAFALALARWPDRGAIALAALLAVLAFAVRYSGAVLLLTLGGWLLLQTRPLRTAGRLGWAGGAVALAALAALALVAWNVAATGYFSGHPRGGSSPITEWPGIVANYGWSPSALLGGIGVRDALGFKGPLRLFLGPLVVIAVLGTGLRAWRRGDTPQRRTLGLVVMAYGAGLIALRWSGHFDSLYNARMFLPLLLPLMLIAAGPWMRRPVALASVALVLILNLALDVRGTSREISADMRGTTHLFQPIRPGEVIVGNDQARTLSAYLDTPVLRFGTLPPQARYVVFAGAGSDFGNLPVTPAERDYARQLGATMGFRVKHDSGSLLVLERSTSVP